MDENYSKYALLAYANEEQKPSAKGIFGFFKKPVIAYTARACNILGEKGLAVTLPVTKETNDAGFKDEVYTNILSKLSEDGVLAVTAVKGEHYGYDSIIPAMSGFYVLPFLLPSVLKKCAKTIDESKPEVVIIGELSDLTLDILCIISQEINNISIYTANTEEYETVIEKFYADSGINIFVTDKAAVCETAHILLNASFTQDKQANKYQRGAVYFDMVGVKNKTRDIALQRTDMIVFDGLELKTDNGYIDNATIEAVLYSADKRFRAYVSGRYTNDDFYGILDKVSGYGLKITALKRFGANI